jgi:hypothetical protein
MAMGKTRTLVTFLLGILLVYVCLVSCKLFEMALLSWFLLRQCLVVFGVFLFLLFGDFGGVRVLCHYVFGGM